MITSVSLPKEEKADIGIGSGVGIARLRSVSKLVLDPNSGRHHLDAQEKVLLANLQSLLALQDQIAKTRLESGLSVREFARRIGCSESEVVRAEEQLGKLTLDRLMIHLMGLGFLIEIGKITGRSWQDL